MELLKQTIKEIKAIDIMYLDKKEVLKRLSLIEKELDKRSEQKKDFKTDSFEWLLEKYTQTSLRGFLEKEGYFTGITKLIDERIKDLNL